MRQLNSYKQIYDDLFEALPLERGKDISRIEREEKRLGDSSLAYGEIEYDSFQRLILMVR